MAVFNELLVGRFNRGLQKLFGMKGRASLRTLSDEMFPVLITEDMMSLELRLLQSWRSFANFIQVSAGGAGNQSAFRLRNPAGSNALVVIEKINLSGQGSANDFPKIFRGPTGTADFGSTLTPGNVRDARMGAFNPIMVISSSVNAGAQVGTAWWQGGLLLNSQVDVILDSNQELVLAPSDVLTCYSNILNNNIAGSIFWRERALEEGEVGSLIG